MLAAVLFLSEHGSLMLVELPIGALNDGADSRRALGSSSRNVTGSDGNSKDSGDSRLH